MDEALDVDNTTQLSTKGQEAWKINLAAQHDSTSIHPAWNVNTRGNFQESNMKELT